jgi:hypothetical protein
MCMSKKKTKRTLRMIVIPESGSAFRYIPLPVRRVPLTRTLNVTRSPSCELACALPSSHAPRRRSFGVARLCAVRKTVGSLARAGPAQNTQKTPFGFVMTDRPLPFREEFALEWP